jgi:CubicO group peptidase (beta-lactamase class C family)
MYATEKRQFDESYGGNSEDAITTCRPGAGGRGPVRELGRIYEMLLNRGRGPAGSSPVLRPQTVEALTARHRAGMYDHTFRHVIDWGLGFIVNSAMYGVDTVPYGYGPFASSRTFGHGGSQSSTAFADPEAGLAVALAFNGMPGEAQHDRRLRAVVGALYEDLGLNQKPAPPAP